MKTILTTTIKFLEKTRIPMKKLLTLLTLLLSLVLITPLTTQGKEEIAIKRVVDGDTFLVSAPFLPKEVKQQMYLRLSNIDTPNIKRWANCDREAELGMKAKQYAENAVNSGKVTIKLVGMDKYNRLLGMVFINKTSLSDLLIKNKLARPYYGGKKQSWCH